METDSLLQLASGRNILEHLNLSDGCLVQSEFPKTLLAESSSALFLEPSFLNQL